MCIFTPRKDTLVPKWSNVPLNFAKIIHCFVTFTPTFQNMNADPTTFISLLLYKLLINSDMVTSMMCSVILLDLNHKVFKQTHCLIIFSEV